MSFFRRNVVQLSEKDAKVRIELAESYSNMTSLAAWMDLEVFMSEMFSQSIKDQDLTPINQFDVAEAAEGRGIRKAIDKIKKHVSFYVREEGE